MIARVFNRLSLAGLSATLVGNGLGRFAFVALMPALIQAGWFSKAQASTLGVATLVGYVFGAMAADALAARWSSAWLLRASMLACALSFLACAFEGAGMAWNVLWRATAGVAGALLMVLPTPLVLPRHDAAIRARTGGVVFSGIGLGAALSGWLVPRLVGGPATPAPAHGVTIAWLVLGALCLALTAGAWRAWPIQATGALPGDDRPPLPADLRRTATLLMLAHGLNAAGYLAHTLFLPDYVVRELGMPLAEGGFYWSMFGVGAALGPMMAGTLADAFGLRRCLLAGFALKAVSAILPVWGGATALLASALLMGLCTPGVVAMVSAYTLEQVGPSHHRRAWGLATSSFAIAQAAGGALMALAATRLASYQPLFCASAVALAGSVVCIALVRERAAPSADRRLPVVITVLHP